MWMTASAAQSRVGLREVVRCVFAVLCAAVLVVAPVRAAENAAKSQPVVLPAAPATQQGVELLHPAGDANAPLQPNQRRVDIPMRPGDGGPLIMLAIAGGGSRAAYYTACVMEQLACIPDPYGHGSVLDRVTVISGVSAGALAGAWYCVNYGSRHDPNFFARFKDAMAVNLQWRAYGNMVLFPPLALQLVATGMTRTDLLADQIAKLLGRPCTFNDLLRDQFSSHDPAPVLVVNGTVYNTGQRLVMSNLPPWRFPSPVGSGKDWGAAKSEADQAAIYHLVDPIHFEEFGSDIGQFRVADAIAGSAAYPVVLAPFRLRVYPNNVPPDLKPNVSPKLLESPYIHVADGGLFENEGLDACLSIVKTMPRNQPIMIIVIMSGFNLETIPVSKNKTWGPIAVISRMYDIGDLKPLAYYAANVAQYHDVNKIDTALIRLRGYDEQQNDVLRNIPTQFKLSGSHREAIDAVSARNVSDMSEGLLSALRGLGKMQRGTAPKAKK